MERAVFGGGCFWCVEGAFKQLKGVHSALPGYAGGDDPHLPMNRFVEENRSRRGCRGHV